MEMVFHLHSDVFDIVKNGTKNVEVRLNDEKRRKLSIGDTLLFLRRPNDDEEIRAKVVGLKIFNNFSKLVDNYDMERLYLADYTKEMFLNELLRFYPLEEQENYGVVAIEFEKITK